MEINQYDKSWLAIVKHIKARREDLLARLQNQNTDMNQTQFLRGQLAELALLESLPTSTVSTAARMQSDTYGL